MDVKIRDGNSRQRSPRQVGVDRIVVDTSVTDPEIVNAISGRATEGHFLVTGLPTDITLSTDIAEEGDDSELLSATLTATPQAVGSVLVELSSDESLLDAAAVQAVPMMSTDDGLLFWDLDDGDEDTVERLEDPYLLVARVHDLRSVHFEQYKEGEEFRNKVLGVNAHVLVLKYGLNFEEYRDVVARARKMPSVVGAAPFIINEMMLAKGDKLSGVLIKGIDPKLMPTVLDLPGQLKAGSLEGLRQPGAREA